MKWTTISLILCMFGVLKEFRPNEPFIYDYLTGPWKNFTAEQVTQEIYPIATYSNFATLILVFLITDFLRYKPVIIICGISGIIIYILILLKTIAALQAVEFFYGLYLSAEVAYYTYIYAKVDKNHYQVVSSYTRSALLFGRFITGVVAQLFVTFKLLDYHQLNYLTLAGQILATAWALFLPSVRQSVYFHPPENLPRKDNESQQYEVISSQTEFGETDYANKTLVQKIRRAYFLLWQDFIKAYTNFHVLKWSLWWALASCGYLQVLSYSQSIWQTCVQKNETIYNGAVEAAYTTIGGLAVFGVGKLHFNWVLLGEGILTTFSFIEAILLFMVSRVYNIWWQYAMYIVFGVIYHVIVTVASFEVAKNISEDSFGLIFGINVFMALTFQSILTFIVTSGNVFVFAVRTQFAIYAAYFAVIGAVFMLMTIITLSTLCRRKDKLTLWNKNEETNNSNNNNGNSLSNESC